MKTNTKTKLGNLALPTTLSLLTLASFASVSINTSPVHAESSSASANASVTVSDTINLTLTGNGTSELIKHAHLGLLKTFVKRLLLLFTKKAEKSHKYVFLYIK